MGKPSGKGLGQVQRRWGRKHYREKYLILWINLDRKEILYTE
jgi:hypothetical protein